MVVADDPAAQRQVVEPGLLHGLTILRASQLRMLVTMQGPSHHVRVVQLASAAFDQIEHNSLPSQERDGLETRRRNQRRVSRTASAPSTFHPAVAKQGRMPDRASLVENGFSGRLRFKFPAAIHSAA